MTREELKDKIYEILYRRFDAPRHGKYELNEATDEIAELLSLPPAEGAEAILHRHIDKQSMDELSVNVWPDMLEAMHEFTAQQPPTAEGAEEIDDETIAWAAEHQCGTPFSERWIGFVKGAKWHRSLHAQRIAEGAEEIEAELRGYARDIVRLHKPIMEVNPQLAMDSIGNDLVKMFNRHAQRIADKMVSERMEQYKAQFKDRPNPLEINPYDSKGIKRIRNRKIH